MNKLMLKKQYMMYAPKKGRLPSGFQEVEYIESTGTQVITIDFVENPLIVPLYVEIDEARTSFTGTDWELSDWIHGGNNYCPFKVHKSKITIRYTSYADVKINTLSLNTRYVFNTYLSNGKQVIKKDGEEVVNLTQTGELSFKRLNIFAYNESQSIGDFSYSKLYSFKLYKDDGYIFNLIPARRKLDGELGLYDLVNGVFYTNQGSGEFIAGEVLKSIKGENI